MESSDRSSRLLKEASIEEQDKLSPSFLKSARDKAHSRVLSNNVTREEEQERKRKPAKVAFKRVARMVKNQITWTKILARDAEEHLQTYVVKHSDGQETTGLSFNVDAFRSDVQSFTGLTSKAKSILMKPSWLRKPNELSYIHNFSMHLKCFDRYSLYTRKELSRVIYYESFGKGRVVIRQGDVGLNFYFIVSGSVLIEVQQEDPQTGYKHTNVIGELGPGASFGELALLHESKRRATIVCKEDAEFLTIDKPDFDMVLRQSHEREWGWRMDIIRGHSFFSNWCDSALQIMAEGSTLLEYPPNTVIVKDLSVFSSDTRSIFLLVKGTCKVLMKLKMVEYGNKSCRRIILPPLNNDSLFKDKQSTILRRWVAVRSHVPGDLFGIGEGLSQTSMVSHQQVQCLALSSMAILKLDRLRNLARHRKEIASLYPSRSSVFKRYMQICQWKAYKKWMVEDVLERVRPSTNSNTKYTDKTTCL